MVEMERLRPRHRSHAQEVVAWTLYKNASDTAKVDAIGISVLGWVSAFIAFYLWHFFASPPAMKRQSDEEINSLREEITRRDARARAADGLMDIYERALILDANPEKLAIGAWINRYSQWKTDAETALATFSRVELWMFRTIGDFRLQMPDGEEQQLKMLRQELRDRRVKLRLIVARALPKDDPRADVMAGKEDA